MQVVHVLWDEQIFIYADGALGFEMKHLLEYLKCTNEIESTCMDTTHLLITACNCALLTLSVDGNPVLSQSSGLLLLQANTSFLRQLSSSSCNCNPFICSFIVKSGSINHSNTLSLGKLSLVNSISSAAYSLTANQNKWAKCKSSKGGIKRLTYNQTGRIRLCWGQETLQDAPSR